MPNYDAQAHVRLDKYVYGAVVTYAHAAGISISAALRKLVEFACQHRNLYDQLITGLDGDGRPCNTREISVRRGNVYYHMAITLRGQTDASAFVDSGPSTKEQN